jgi:hypothetical protein
MPPPTSQKENSSLHTMQRGAPHLLRRPVAFFTPVPLLLIDGAQKISYWCQVDVKQTVLVRDG